VEPGVDSVVVTVVFWLVARRPHERRDYVRVGKSTKYSGLYIGPGNRLRAVIRGRRRTRALYRYTSMACTLLRIPSGRVINGSGPGGRQMLMRSFVRHFLCVTAVTGLLLAAAAQPAWAIGQWQLTDGFEVDASTTWSFEHAGVGSGNIFTGGPPSSESGTHAAAIRTTGASSWSAVRRNINFPTSHGLCGASIAIVPVFWQPDGHVHVNVELIDPTTWAYVQVQHADFTRNGWQRVHFTSFASIPTVMVFRVAVLGVDGAGITVFVDSLNVVCSVP